MPEPKNESTPVRLNRAQRRNQKRRSARDRKALKGNGPRAPRPEPRGGRRYNASSRHRGKK